MKCRRKPLEFECWTWDGDKHKTPPEWVGGFMLGISTGNPCIWIGTDGPNVPLFSGWSVIQSNGHNRAISPTEFAAEFDLVPEKLKPMCVCSIENLLLICGRFEEHKGREYCDRCGHNKECHAP